MDTDPITGRAKEVFFEALEQPSRTRPTFVRERCVDDPALRQRVDALLEAHELSQEVFGDPCAAWGPRGSGLVLLVRSRLRWGAGRREGDDGPAEPPPK